MVISTYWNLYKILYQLRQIYKSSYASPMNFLFKRCFEEDHLVSNYKLE